VATQYCSWADDVLSVYPVAADIESDSDNQTALIEAKSQLLKTYLRGQHKDWLETNSDGEYDEAVKEITANLVASELMGRRPTDDTMYTPGEYDHIKSEMFNRFDHAAHSKIDSIRTGKLILEQDDAQRDLNFIEPVVITQTGTSKPLIYTPYGYTGLTERIFTIEITTTGRVEDSTAQWQGYWDYADDDPGVAARDCDDDLYEIGYGVYVKFRDVATTGNSYADGDKYDVKLVPRSAEVESSGVEQLDAYSG